MTSRGWQVTALQSDNTDIASHALLRLWQHVHHLNQQPASRKAALCEQFTALAPRAWRRLALLLFAEDALSVKAVVSVAVALAVPGESQQDDDDAPRRSVQQRIWQTDWRQCVMDKLIDCHARATIAGATTTPRGDADVALRLLVVLRAVFFEALRSGSATPRDQVRTIDLFVELALTPVDSIACVALQVLHALLGDTREALRLDSDVRAYLEGSRVFADLVARLQTSLQSPTGTNSSQRSHRHRHRLAMDLLVSAARSSADVVGTIARPQPEPLLDLVLCVAESDRPTQHARGGGLDAHELSARGLQLLAVVLHHHELPIAAELAGAIRLGGALITVAWLLGHTSHHVRAAAHDVFKEVILLSAARDLVRAVVEQGCVLVCYTLLADETRENDDDDAPCRTLLQWVLALVESEEDQFLRSMAMSARRSTNAKLQRNVILSLLLLSHSSDAARAALFSDGSLTDVVRDAVSASGADDTRLVTALIATALLGSDTRSTLKRDPATASNANFRVVSVESTVNPPRGPACQLTLCCKGGERVVVASCFSVTTHCKLFARALLCPPTPPSMTVDLRSHGAPTVAWLVRLLPLSPQHAVRELQRVATADTRLVEQLLRLAKAVECTKCWHAASLVISNSLGSHNWRAALALAVELRHPALLLRALRAALASDDTPTPAVANEATPPTEAKATRDLMDAAMLVWHELLATSHG